MFSVPNTGACGYILIPNTTSSVGGYVIFLVYPNRNQLLLEEI